MKKPITKPVKASEIKRLQTIYGVTNPRQIKEKIMWKHIMALVLAVAGNTAANAKKLKQYNLHFVQAEKAENEWPGFTRQ